MLGFIAPAVLGMVSGGWSSRPAIATMVAAGAVEGLLLGAAQAHALAPSLPGLRSGRFAVNAVGPGSPSMLSVPASFAHRS
jgi:hypothetical protein